MRDARHVPREFVDLFETLAAEESLQEQACPA
jgi:hypothetical protein